MEAAKLLRKAKMEFDIAYTSVLKRAIRTLWIIMEENDRLWLPVERDWRLNERHYGALQGLSKAETIKKYGEEQVRLWRRSYKPRPPLLKKTDKRYPGKLEMFRDVPKKEVPLGESLEDTLKRVKPCWQKEIAPKIRAKKRILIVAHGNSIRAIIKMLENTPDDEITKVEISTGLPLVYELDKNLKPKKSYYLGNAEAKIRESKSLLKRK